MPLHSHQTGKLVNGIMPSAEENVGKQRSGDMNRHFREILTSTGQWNMGIYCCMANFMCQPDQAIVPRYLVQQFILHIAVKAFFLDVMNV